MAQGFETKYRPSIGQRISVRSYERSNEATAYHDSVCARKLYKEGQRKPKREISRGQDREQQKTKAGEMIEKSVQTLDLTSAINSMEARMLGLFLSSVIVVADHGVWHDMIMHGMVTDEHNFTHMENEGWAYANFKNETDAFNFTIKVYPCMGKFNWYWNLDTMPTATVGTKVLDFAYQENTVMGEQTVKKIRVQVPANRTLYLGFNAYNKTYNASMIMETYKEDDSSVLPSIPETSRVNATPGCDGTKADEKTYNAIHLSWPAPPNGATATYQVYMAQGDLAKHGIILGTWCGIERATMAGSMMMSGGSSMDTHNHGRRRLATGTHNHADSHADEEKEMNMTVGQLFANFQSERSACYKGLASDQHHHFYVVAKIGNDYAVYPTAMASTDEGPTSGAAPPLKGSTALIMLLALFAAAHSVTF
eukprot:g12219.t1